MAMGTAQSRELNLKPFHFKELFWLKQSQKLKLKDLRKCSIFLYYPLDSRIISRSKYVIFMLHLGKWEKQSFTKMVPDLDRLVCFLVKNLFSSSWYGRFSLIMKNKSKVLKNKKELPKVTYKVSNWFENRNLILSSFFTWAHETKWTSH